MNKLPPQETLEKLVSYDASTGVLTWKDRAAETCSALGLRHSDLAGWNTQCAGKPAFNGFVGNGYLAGRLFGTQYRAHRIIWKLVYGEEPNQIDHIDGNRTNNVLSNLRNVSVLENQRNRKVSQNSSSGVSGVRWCRFSRSWIARIGVSGKMQMIGRFADFPSAVAARKRAEREYGFHPNHGRG